MPAKNEHIPIAIEVTYPFALGGEMMDGYCCNDNEMAQSAINMAIESAKYLERQRIIETLKLNKFGEAADLIGEDGNAS